MDKKQELDLSVKAFRDTFSAVNTRAPEAIERKSTRLHVLNRVRTLDDYHARDIMDELPSIGYFSGRRIG